VVTFFALFFHKSCTKLTFLLALLSYIETKQVLTAFEDLVRANDLQGVAALRRIIQQRIEDLEAFYLSNVEKEESVLFEKQRLKLRRLLQEHDNLMNQINGEATVSTRMNDPSSNVNQSNINGNNINSNAAQNVVMTTKVIREDTRLTLIELSAWFVQAGNQEMPEVTSEIVERIFNTVTRTNLDGKMSIRDLRQWYITFGRRAIASGIDLLEKETILAPQIVSKLTKTAAGGHFVTPASARRPTKPAVDHSATTSSLSATQGASKATQPAHPAAATPQHHHEPAYVAPATLPNGMIELQVRLTAEEYAQVTLKKRQLAAEERYRARISAAAKKGTSRVAAGVPETFEVVERDPYEEVEKQKHNLFLAGLRQD
jgi:hypothetical protein